MRLTTEQRGHYWLGILLITLTACSSPNDKPPNCNFSNYPRVEEIKHCKVHPQGDDKPLRLERAYRNLVFEGGGVKGIAYFGALEALHNHGQLEKIERVGGASAGAITSTLVALGYNSCEIKNYGLAFNYEKLADGSFFGDMFRVIGQYGWYRGNYFQCAMECVIKQKTGHQSTSFEDLQQHAKEEGFKQLYVVATNVNTRDTVTFSHEHETYSKTPIADAIRLSISIPFFYRVRTFKNDLFDDGGVLKNYPLDLFDHTRYRDPSDPESCRTPEEPKHTDIHGPEFCKNLQTLGFHLGSQRSEHYEVNNAIEFAKETFETIVAEQTDMLCLDEADIARTVFINPHDVHTTDFKIKDKKKRHLIEWGREATEKYLEREEPRTSVPGFVIGA